MNPDLSSSQRKNAPVYRTYINPGVCCPSPSAGAQVTSGYRLDTSLSLVFASADGGTYSALCMVRRGMYYGEPHGVQVTPPRFTRRLPEGTAASRPQDIQPETASTIPHGPLGSHEVGWCHGGHLVSRVFPANSTNSRIDGEFWRHPLGQPAIVFLRPG